MKDSVIYGLGELNEYLDKICSMEEMYKHSNKINPPHIIVNLESGCGQTYVTKAVARRYKEHSLRPFYARDQYLELCIDGDIDQMEKAFSSICERLQEYRNEPSGVVAMDITGLSEYVDEKPMEVFLDHIHKLADDVMFLFFVSSKESRNQDKMIERITDELHGDADRIIVPPYSTKELVSIALNQLSFNGIGFCGDMDHFFEVWEKKLDEDGVRSPKQAIKLSHQFLRFFNKETHVIDCRTATRFLMQTEELRIK